jgi:hypothetical protein
MRNRVHTPAMATLMISSVIVDILVASVIIHATIDRLDGE